MRASALLLVLASLCISHVCAYEDPLTGELLSLELECPILECGDDTVLEDDTCFKHDAKASSKVLSGRLCFNETNARQSETRYVCPFNLDEYMWVNETLQGYELYNSHGKFSK